VGKINSKTSKVIRSGSKYKFLPLTLTHLYLLPDLMNLLVLLLIIPTLDSHSNSFVSTTEPNDFTSLTVNLPHS
jgi:hypothetical protein